MDIKPTRPTLAQEAGAALDQKGSPSSGAQPFMSQFVIRTMAGDLKNHPQSVSGSASGSSISEIPPAPKPPAPAITAQPQPALKPLAATPAAQQPALKMPAQTIAEEPGAPADKTKELAKIAADEKKKREEQERKSTKEAAERQAEAALIAAKEKALAEKQIAAEIKNARKQELDGLFEQAELEFAAKEFNAAVADAQKIVDSADVGWLTKWRASRIIKKAQKEARKEEARKIQMSAPPAPKPPAPAITAQPQPALKPLAATPAAQQPALKMPAQTIAEEPGAPAGLPVIPLTKEPELFFETRPEPPKIPIPAPPAPVEKPLASAQLIPSTPVAPSAPAKISTAPPKIPAGLTFEAPEEKELDVKKILTIGLSSVAVLALIIGGIWFLLKSPAQQPAQISQTPTPSPSQTIAPPAAETPSAIFETDAQKIFLLKDNQEKADLQDALLQMTETEEPVGDFIHLAFKNSRGEFLSLDKVALLIGSDFFDLPTQTSAGNLKKQLNLAQSSFFAYSQSSNKNSDSPFNPSLANLGRLGLTVAASAASADELGRSLKDLEQMMLNGLGILLPSAKNNFPANPVFSDNIHSGVAIRYINLPNSDLSLDYAILNNKLIFATSKESMFAIIDRILSANEQSNQP